MPKKIVHYYLSPAPYKFGNGACLWPVNHPDTSRVSNVREVFTSRVVNWDEETGIIETQNTIYIPEEQNANS